MCGPTPDRRQALVGHSQVLVGHPQVLLGHSQVHERFRGSGDAGHWGFWSRWVVSTSGWCA
jgi:hypothetical protein